MIVIVDYGVGNPKSIANMLRKIGVPCSLSSRSEDIYEADKLILPGVGHFSYAMENLEKNELIGSLNWFAQEAKRPILGICIGAHLMGKGSDESEGTPGLGWVDMYCHRFPSDNNFRVPHMSWSEIKISQEDRLLLGLQEKSRFYFVHSYYMQCDLPHHILAQSFYGIWYTCIFKNNNIYGTQFHPEKSHRYGMKLLESFAQL